MVRAFLARLFLDRVLADRSVEVGTVLPIVRRYPYWLAGHLFVGERSLRDKDVGRAYAASQAVLTAAIPGAERYKKDAAFLVARCHLAKGDASAALKLFEDWTLQYSSTPLANEEIAACLMALNRLPEARAKLESIPASERSQEARAALLFLQNKLDEQVN